MRRCRVRNLHAEIVRIISVIKHTFVLKGKRSHVKGYSFAYIGGDE